VRAGGDESQDAGRDFVDARKAASTRVPLLTRGRVRDCHAASLGVVRLGLIAAGSDLPLVPALLLAMSSTILSVALMPIIISGVGSRLVCAAIFQLSIE
jgi:hypothetical protein